MDENTSSTNVDSTSKKDKYLEDIENNRLLEIAGYFPGIIIDNEKEKFETVGEAQIRDSKGNVIQVDRIEVPTDAIKIQGSIDYVLVRTDDLEKVKKIARARGEKSKPIEKSQDIEK